MDFLHAARTFSLVRAALPEHLRWLFWETDAAAVDAEAHRDYVLERVMARGDWSAMRWARATYSSEVLADFLRRKGHRLPPRDLAYWALVAGIDVTIPAGGARPAWAGPCPPR